MAVNLSIKNVPDDLAERLRLVAAQNHRSLQGQLLAILEAAAAAQVRGGAVREPESVVEVGVRADRAALDAVIGELEAVRRRTKGGRDSLARLRDAGRRV